MFTNTKTFEQWLQFGTEKMKKWHFMAAIRPFQYSMTLTVARLYDGFIFQLSFPRPLSHNSRKHK